MDLEEQLKKWFGYNFFRAFQKQIIENVLNEKDVVAILPTGAGKSICYQLPALLMEGTAVVISPLISLMQDQVAALTKAGIAAAYVNSSLTLTEIKEIFRNLSCYKLLYIAPERLNDPHFLELLKKLNLSFFVIDEAHCISQWGHSFRPDYRQLAIIKDHFKKPLLALTATATNEVEKDIMAQLKLKDPLLFKGSFDRPNLHIRMSEKQDAFKQITSFLTKYANESGIIYASTRKTVDSLYEQLRKNSLKVGKYHAGLSDKERQEALHDFIHDKTHLMVATVAFGMGINKPDIRFVIHHDMPQSIEQYYQEIGRGGRDGLPAECWMFYSAQDLMIYKSFLKNEKDPLLQSQAELKMRKIYNLCRSFQCRRTGLLQYFGESFPTRKCSGCDNCVGDIEVIEGTVIAQKILSCVYRLEQRVGVRTVIDVLKGAKTKTILENRYDQLSTYHLMPECSEIELRYYIDSLITLGFLKIANENGHALEWTENSRKAIKGEEKITFRKIITKEVQLEMTELPYDKVLFEELRNLRSMISKEEGMPAFNIFNDRSLYEMATSFPRTEKELLSINGVGRFKVDQYGQRFMTVIRQFSAKKLA